MTAVRDLALSLSGLIMVMRGAGANNDPLLAAISNGIGTETEVEDEIEVLTFDINGYPSSDIVRFTRSNRHTVLYIPGETPSFHEFGSEEALDRWVKEMAASPEERTRLAHHFSLYNLQDGFWYTGVANGLEKLGSGAWSTGVDSENRPYSDNLFSELAENMRQRSLSDADILIKSDSEVTRDIWIGNLRTFNKVFWPILMLAPELEFATLATTMGSELVLETEQGGRRRYLRRAESRCCRCRLDQEAPCSPERPLGPPSEPFQELSRFLLAVATQFRLRPFVPPPRNSRFVSEIYPTMRLIRR